MRKRSKPKMTHARRSAAGEECTLNFPGCMHDRETVVLCHLRQFGGGGTSLKPPDNEAVYGCMRCHDIVDGRVPWILGAEDFDFWKAIAFAIVKTQRRMRAKGVLVYKGEEAA
jgi:hypothetical protein